MHDCEFQQARYCPECKFKWPSQNYLASTVQPNGQFWLDGFRTEDGKVRQYIFTEEEARGVAAAKIGSARVFAIGIALYRSKKAKPKREILMRDADITFTGATKCCSFRGSVSGQSIRSFSPCHTPQNWNVDKISTQCSCDEKFDMSDTDECMMMSSNCAGAPPGGVAPAATDADIADMENQLKEISNDPNLTIVTHHGKDMGFVGYTKMEQKRSKATKNYEVGAGANIDQKVYEDPTPLEEYEDEPYAMIYVNYTNQDTIDRILAQGKRQDKKEGMLEGIPVGNP